MHCLLPLSQIVEWLSSFCTTVNHSINISKAHSPNNNEKNTLKFSLIIPEVLVRSVMSLYEGAKTRARVDSELSEELVVKVGMHQGSVLSPFLFAVVVDAVTELAREFAPSELLYADDFVLMSETIEGLRNKFLKWKEVF